MGHFSYCFCISLIHSLWQGAVLLGIFKLLHPKRSDPSSKRNFLYFLLLAQVLLSVCTFYIYYTGNLPGYNVYITAYDDFIKFSLSYIEKFSPMLAFTVGNVFRITLTQRLN